MTKLQALINLVLGVRINMGKSVDQATGGFKSFDEFQLQLNNHYISGIIVL